MRTSTGAPGTMEMLCPTRELSQGHSCTHIVLETVRIGMMLNILLLRILQSQIILSEVLQYYNRNYAYYPANGKQIPLSEIVSMTLNPRNYSYSAQCAAVEWALWDNLVQLTHFKINKIWDTYLRPKMELECMAPHPHLCF